MNTPDDVPRAAAPTSVIVHASHVTLRWRLVGVRLQIIRVGGGT